MIARMSTIAQTRDGRVEGVRENDLVVFRGIPFAAPPVGERRWAAPESPEPWTGVRPAREFGAVAHQNPIPLDILAAFDVGDNMNEDCLYLNVWTPAVDSARRPAPPISWSSPGRGPAETSERAFNIARSSRMRSSRPCRTRDGLPRILPDSSFA